MHTLVRQLVNDDGDKVPEDEQCWHLTQSFVGDAGILCTQEFTDPNACNSINAKYVFKEVKRGGITCKKCMEILMEFKSIKL